MLLYSANGISAIYSILTKDITTRLVRTYRCTRTRRSRVPSRQSVSRWRCRFWADYTTNISGRKFPTGTGRAFSEGVRFCPPRSIIYHSANAVARIDGPVDIEPFGRRTARHSRLLELASPRDRVAMPHRHVLGMGWAERAGMEEPAVVVGIKMVRLHEPHQVHRVDACREPAIGFMDVAAHRLGARDAGVARRLRDRAAILGIRYHVRLSLGRALARYPRECRIDGSIHACKIRRAKAFEDTAQPSRVGAGGLIRGPRHPEAERLHHLER